MKTLHIMFEGGHTIEFKNAYEYKVQLARHGDQFDLISVLFSTRNGDDSGGKSLYINTDKVLAVWVD